MTGDSDIIMDEDVRRTIAVIMRGGGREVGDVRENRLELLDETVEHTKQLCSLGMWMWHALHLV